MAMPPQLLILLACYSGFLSHTSYFNHGEHHLHSLLYLVLIIAFPTVGALFSHLAFRSNAVEVLATLPNLQIWCLASVFASLVLYRVSPIHRLSKFPGPWSWRLSKLLQVWNNRSLRAFEEWPRLHQQYGECVRTGETPQTVTQRCY